MSRSVKTRQLSNAGISGAWRPKITAQGIRRLSNVRQLAAKDTATALDIGQCIEWINALLTAGGMEQLLLPQTVADANELRTRMDVVCQFVKAQVQEENQDTIPIEQTSLSIRSKGKARQFAVGKLPQSVVREAALRATGLLRKGK